MSTYAFRSSLDELHAKRPNAVKKTQEHLCWLPKASTIVASIDFLMLVSLRRCCASTRADCEHYLEVAVEMIHGDYAAQYVLERAA